MTSLSDMHSELQYMNMAHTVLYCIILKGQTRNSNNALLFTITMVSYRACLLSVRTYL